MADKYQHASYLSSLLSIVESQDKAGGMNRSALLSAEFERAYAEFKDILTKEKDDEAGKRNEYTVRGEKRTDL